jgi:hypothetical protein
MGNDLVAGVAVLGRAEQRKLRPRIVLEQRLRQRAEIARRPALGRAEFGARREHHQRPFVLDTVARAHGGCPLSAHAQVRPCEC